VKTRLSEARPRPRRFASRLARAVAVSALAALPAAAAAQPAEKAAPPAARAGAETLIYHPIKTDAAGKIIPWHGPELGRAYDHVIRLVWSFWDRMALDRNGLPYHMNHQVWRETLDDHRGIGGDQIQMALSSWALLQAYLGGNTEGDAFGRIIENMRSMADWYLSHSLSPANAKWPHLPYPYNTFVYSGIYDGDMILGPGYTQPDKAGSLGAELVTLYKITKHRRYLDAAVLIADTLAAKTKAGDAETSPLPFKVNALTGELGVLRKDGKVQSKSGYTTNWPGTLVLFEQLEKLGEGNAKAYRRAHELIVAWMKKHPMKTNKWGPFFEDIPGWSDTQINAVTWAEYMMERPQLFPAWKTEVRGILDWAWKELGNDEWKKYGVVVMNEQTAYRVPGNSHTSRQSSAELRYAELTGDTSRKENAIRGLSWATYMVDKDGKNRYPRDGIWMTDGYGDYVRHYLRAMAAAPELAPDDGDHVLRSTSVVARMSYAPNKIVYTTFDQGATELVRLTSKPKRVSAAGAAIAEQPELSAGGTGDGWSWQALAPGKGGLLRVRHTQNKNVTIEK
jgi:hypothetical protein